MNGKMRDLIYGFIVTSVLVSNAPASTFRIIDLGTFGGTMSNAYAINASGQVTGFAAPPDGNFQAFRYDHGVLHGLGTYGVKRSRGWGINDHGLVVGDDGYDGNSSSFLQGKAWKNDGTGATGISTGYTEDRESIAYDVNNNGVIVGRNNFPWATGDHAFYYDGGNYMTDLGTLHPNGRSGTSAAFAINDVGQIVGLTDAGYNQPARAFIYENGVMSDLGSLGYSAYAQDINEPGVAVGTSRASRYGQNHAVIFRDGTVVDIGTLGGDSSAAQAINDHGQVVGSSRTASDDTHAFLYTGDEMIDLNDLLGEDSDWTKLVSANDINNRGDIVGQGLINGESHAYLITTVPLPAAASLLFSGILGLSGFARNRNHLVRHGYHRRLTIPSERQQLTSPSAITGSLSSGGNAAH